MILVFGKTGQVACELAAQAPEAVYLGREQADLTDPKSCAAAIHQYAPSVVINAAAYTAVDKAEDDIDTAQLVNADAPIAMAEACKALGIPFIHISTDYVFDGEGETPFAVEDPVAAINVYGRTKSNGELGIRKTGACHAILRTSWVFSAHGNNFVKTMLRLSETRDALSIVADQVGGPTSARAIAAACLVMARRLQSAPEKSGTYHFSGTPNVSWAGFAQTIFVQAGRTVAVTPIPTASYPTPAKRPLNSRLNCDVFETTFGTACPNWKSDLKLVLKELGVE